MATACLINIYESYSDRGAFVQKAPWMSKEIDEEELVVGNPLPQWNSFPAPLVKFYDGKRLDLEYEGKIYSIKTGEEIELTRWMSSQQYGVTCEHIQCVKVVPMEIIYKGNWQSGSTIRQVLEGPVGDGEVWYPNGDKFKGYFHLSFASINGPAYAAEGRYDFADGSYIEHAWLVTSSNRKTFFLTGVYRIKHPDAEDSIAMFLRGKRYGFELTFRKTLSSFPPDPHAKEWYANERIWHGPDGSNDDPEVLDYDIDETDVNSIRLTLKLRTREGINYKVIQKGGRYEANKYDQMIYDPSVKSTLYYPNGDSIDHYGSCVRCFHPYDGWITIHNAKTGKMRSEEWKKGEMVNAQEWKYDIGASKSLELPDPFGQGMAQANVWAIGRTKGHIEYAYGEWVYDGKMVDNRPEGHGVLVGDRFRHEGCRYEGEFHEGRCHGKGVFENTKAGIRQEGMFVAGVYQEPNAATAPITLHARYGHQHWSASGSGDWTYEECDFEPKLGRLIFVGFGDIEIARIEKDCITLTQHDKTYMLAPGCELHFSAEIEGREWSDGCSYDGDDYSLALTWKE
ncbi:MAG: hypothetical protein IKG99_06955 [Bacteroidaceae bacterium]|nr:hypothetical protein [Bacteroidaceae bacterium]